MNHLPLQYCSRGIITDRDGRVLLVKHRSHKPYTLPGGHLEKDETFQDALIREAREELDITLELVGMVSIYRENNIRSLPAPVRVQLIEYDNEKGTQNKYEEFFLAQIVAGTIAVNHSEIASFAWCTLDQIRDMSDSEIYASIRDIVLSTENQI